MRYNPYMENPTHYSRPPEHCAMRWCTEDAIEDLLVVIADVILEGEETHATIPVCKVHRDVIEKSRDQKGLRANTR